MASVIVRAEAFAHAVTYLTPSDGAESCGVELVTTRISVERNGDLIETRRVSWHAGGAGAWSLGHADALIAELGLARSGSWCRLDTGEPAPVTYGCTVVAVTPVQRSEAPRLTLVSGEVDLCEAGPPGRKRDGGRPPDYVGGAGRLRRVGRIGP